MTALDPIPLSGGIRLEPRINEHAPGVFAAIERNRDHLRRWLSWAETTRSVDDVLAFYQRGDTKRDLGELLEYIIVEDGAVIGVIDIHSIDRFTKTGRIGYWLVEAAQGRGIMTRAVAALTEFAFTKAGMNRLEIRMSLNNSRSRAIPILWAIALSVTWKKEAALL